MTGPASGSTRWGDAGAEMGWCWRPEPQKKIGPAYDRTDSLRPSVGWRKQEPEGSRYKLFLTRNLQFTRIHHAAHRWLSSHPASGIPPMSSDLSPGLQVGEPMASAIAIPIAKIAADATINMRRRPFFLSKVICFLSKRSCIADRDRSCERVIRLFRA